MCLGSGPSQNQKDLQQSQADFYKTLQKAFQTQFAKQGAILDSLNSTFAPIMKAGPNQFGFDKPEETALRTQASDATARNYEAASKAVEGKFAGQGGGNVVVPSGAKMQLENELAGSAAESESNKQLDITKAGYEQGRQNFTNAAQILGGAAAMYNPTGFAGAANQGGGEAERTASDIASEDGSLWSTVGGILGGGLSAFAGGFGTGLGQRAGGKKT